MQRAMPLEPELRAAPLSALKVRLELAAIRLLEPIERD